MIRSIVAGGALLCCLIPLVVADAHESRHAVPSPVTGDLGETEFPNSGAPEAQPDFLRGLLLLHSFEFDSARAAFGAASDKDPGFAMAYWGEALSHNMAIWGEQDLEAARAVLAKLAPTREERLAKAPTERERGYLSSVELLFGEGDKADRDARYSAALGELARKYPEDLDARSFYALSLLGLTGYTRNVENYMRAAAEAEAVYEINKRHPGALHYLIHAYDDPVHAPLGLRAARLYGKVAPAASHAQHMPSHIFFALGMWDDAIEANIASLATARSQGHGGYHALEWLTYAYLQVGNEAEAGKLVDLLQSDVQQKGTRASRSSLAWVRSMWLVETGGAGREDAWQDVDDTGIVSIGSHVTYDFARGLVAAQAGRLEAAEQSLGSLRARAEKGRALMRGVTADRNDTVTEEEMTWAGIMSDALDGAVRFRRGEREAGLALVQRALDTESGLEFTYGPPWAAKPIRELYADLLLEAGRRDEAAEAYRSVLKTHPGRRLAKTGLASAQSAA